MWLKLPAHLSTIFGLLVFVVCKRFGQSEQAEAAFNLSVARRLFSDTASLYKQEASWDIDWSSDDATSSWGWRQVGFKPRWGRALPSPHSSLAALLSASTKSVPDSLRSFITCRVSAFITSFSILFQSQIPSCLFVKRLSPSAQSL